VRRASGVIVSVGMDLPAHAKYVACVVIFFLFGLLFHAAASGQNPSQSKSSTSPRETRHDSVEVVAHLSPEEVEEGRLNDAYERISQLQRKGTCSMEIIQRYQSEIIPLAEKATFNVPRNKFLFLANRDIGNCYMAQQRYQEAEGSFKKIMEYQPVWPGTDDSDYPINFRQIATAQMGQQRWGDAEESLKKSVALFGPQIERALKSDSEFGRTEHAGNLVGSQARSISYLAIVYLRQGPTLEAQNAAEQAYAEATRPHVPITFVKEVVTVGSSIAQQSGDVLGMAKWLWRGSGQD
jgi:tetratricopeptide (TPR) repeat protein